jgi:hypothetical protein
VSIKLPSVIPSRLKPPRNLLFFGVAKSRHASIGERAACR